MNVGGYLSIPARIIVVNGAGCGAAGIGRRLADIINDPSSDYCMF
jgi:ATP-dependent protease HslVU (ClpYQ) ATPase subunit